MSTEIKKRLIELSKALHMNPSQFSKSLGRDRSYISNITKEVSTDLLREIYCRYNNVNLTWIITGEGDMFLQNADENVLLTHFKCENSELRNKIESLNREIGGLEAQVAELKKGVHVEGPAKCAAVSGSDLVK